MDVFLVDATCGAPAPVNLTRSPSFNESGPTWSPDALRIAVAVSDSAGAPGAWVSVCDLNGEAFGPCETLDFPGPGGPSGLDWSRQGDRLAVHNYVGSGDDLWVYSFVDASWIRLTTTPLQEAWPTWSPDDGRIAFCRRDSQNLNLYVVEAVPGATIRDLAKPKPGTTRYWMPDWRRY